MSTLATNFIFNTGEPAYAVNRHGSIVAWNAAAEEMFGYSAEQAIGLDCWKLLRGLDTFGNLHCCEHCPLREMVSLHQPVNRCRMAFRTADGLMMNFTVSTLVLLNEPGGEVLVHVCTPELAGSAMPRTPKVMGNMMPGKGKDVLTSREKAVLKCLEEGYSTREVSTLLSISVSTVRNHIEHILQKLYAHSRLEAVATARRLNLI